MRNGQTPFFSKLGYGVRQMNKMISIPMDKSF